MIEFLVLQHAVQENDRCRVRFHCPACGFRNVDGNAWAECHNTRLLFLLPIMRQKFNWVEGSCCKRKLLSRVSPRELTEFGADEIEAKRMLVEGGSAVSLVLLIGAYLFCIMPIFGPIFLISAWVVGGTSRPWFRIACRVALLLHLVAMNGIVLAYFVNERR